MWLAALVVGARGEHSSLPHTAVSSALFHVSVYRAGAFSALPPLLQLLRCWLIVLLHWALVWVQLKDRLEQADFIKVLFDTSEIQFGSAA